MTDRIEAIRARHAARLRTRAAKGDGSVQMSTLVDDDVAVLLAEVKEAREDARHFEAEYDDAVRENRGLTRQNRILKVWNVSLRTALAPAVSDAEPEMLGGDPNHKYLDATYPTDGEQPGPDWRPLSEDVTGHTMGPARSHADGRICMYHHRLDAWTWDFVSECLRDHEDPR